MNAETEDLWRSLGIEPAFLLASAEWVMEARGMHGNALRHFEVAASLLRFSQQDYKLGSAAFFHAVLGLEKALRLYYQDTENSLQDLLRRAQTEARIGDSLFINSPELSSWFRDLVKRLLGTIPASPADLLVALIPRLRNEYLHGNYILAPDFVHLTRQVRTIADQLDTNRKQVRAIAPTN